MTYALICLPFLAVAVVVAVVATRTLPPGDRRRRWLMKVWVSWRETESC